MNYASQTAMFALCILSLALFGLYKYEVLSAWWTIPPLVLAAVFYALQYQINEYLIERFPPKIDERIIQFLKDNFSFYNQLSVWDQEKFIKRLGVFLNLKYFETKGMEKMPIEAKAIVAANGVQLTFGLNKYLLEEYNRVIFYPSAFPSPQHRHLHASETHTDGVMLLALDRLIYSITNRKQGFNISLYEWANIWQEEMNIDPDDFPQLKEETYKEILPKIRGYQNFDSLYRFMGLSYLNPLSVAIEHFFYTPQTFKEHWPVLYQELCNLLNQNPINAQHPVVSDETLKVD